MKSFLNACGLREALRIVIEGPRAGGGESRVLPHPFAVIGRDERADVILDDPRVGRRHVYLQAVAGQVFWLDLESRTGICDETGTKKSGWLAVGGLLAIGPFVIRRDGDGGPGGTLGPREPVRESPLAVRTYNREPLPAVSLEFLNGPSQSTVWPMNRVMSLIGSAKGCKFRLTDPSVSAFHASLLRTPTGLWVVDLRGGRSLSVNSEPVRFGSLVEGDVLGIGRYQMRVRCREPRAGTYDEPAPGLPARRERGEIARRPAPGRGGLAASAPSAFAGSLFPMPSLPMAPGSMPVIASATNVELVSSDAAALGRFQPEVGESVLVPLVNQFSMMQQQMFDQFQQAMGMLVQMFGKMHSEQMEVIREELDRLHDLSRELQELKDELAKSSGRASPSQSDLAAAPAAAAPIAPAAPAVPVTPAAAAPAAEASTDRRPVEVPAAWAGAPSAAPRAGTPPTRVSEPSPKADAPGQRRPIGPAPAAPSPPMAPCPDQSRPGVGSPGATDGPGPPAADQDAVRWIHQRIMTIQHERETRWQKILKLIPGMP